MMRKNMTNEPSLTVLKIAAFIIIIAGIMFAKTIVTPFLLALFISIVCAQPIFWLEKKKFPGWLAIVIMLIVILSLFLGFGYLVGGAISSFTTNTPTYEASLKEISDTFIHYLNDHGLTIADDQYTKLLEPSSILNFTVQAVQGLVNITGNFFLIFLIILFMFLELTSIPYKMRAINHGSKESLNYFGKIITSIRHYLAIKTIIAIVTSMLIYVALSIIGVDYAILWALTAGVMSFIPHIGSILAGIPALLFALVQLGTGGALWTLISFLAVNNILGNFIEPRIMGRGLGLSPLVVFLSLIFWGFILGTVGMFLSVPLTITIKIVLEQSDDTRWIAILLGGYKDVNFDPKNLDKENILSKDAKQS